MTSVFKTAFVAIAVSLSASFSGESLALGETGSAGTSGAGHTREEETARIRTHHLGRLDEKLHAEPEALRAACRYESEISTAPPARRVVLTFDDGPEPQHTGYILDTLRKYHIPATFFLIGYKAKLHPELVARIRDEGRHLVANHSWDHPNFHDIDPSDQAGEVLKGEEPIEAELAPKLFRYPYGNSTCATNSLLRAHGYKIIGWHVDSCDWAYDRTGSVDEKEALSCGVLAQNRSDFVGHVVSAVRAHNGGIVLFHEIHPNTLKQLDEIIVRLLQDGYTFTALTDEAFSTSLR